MFKQSKLYRWQNDSDNDNSNGCFFVFFFTAMGILFEFFLVHSLS